MTLLVETRFGVQIEYEHISSHTGEPGNELVDWLAYQARLNKPLTPCEDWLEQVTTDQFLQQADWFWALWASEFAGLWKGSFLIHPVPAQVPEGNFLPVQDPAVEEVKSREAKLHLRFLTCNVLSLKGSATEESAMPGLARQRALFTQIAEEQIHIFALQETRLRKLHQFHEEDYLTFKAAASAQGHYGILVGVARRLPYGHLVDAASRRPRPLFFVEEHFAILAYNPRYLVMKVVAPYLRMIIIAAHAPHSGYEEDTVQGWWQEVFDSIPIHLRSWPIVTLCDANTAVGGCGKVRCMAAGHF
eukprot:s334_g13.t1